LLILKAILLGAVQGLTEFFPVSSAGHVSLLGNVLGVEVDLFFTVMLHLGTLAAVILFFYSEIRRCFFELAGLVIDICYNIRQLFSHMSIISDEHIYRRIFSNNYRKIAVILLVAILPVILIGALSAPLVELLCGNVLCSGMGLFITALILYVASYTKGNRKGPKEARFSDAVMIGAFQAISVIPGISRYAMTYSCGLYKGLTKKLSRLLSFLLMLPVVAGAFVFEGARTSWSAPAAGLLPAIAGMAAAAVVGYFVIRLAFRLMEKIPLRALSAYCLCMGVLSVVVYLI
jgi:undecaprenyl-diphosphatase